VTYSQHPVPGDSAS